MDCQLCLQAELPPLGERENRIYYHCPICDMIVLAGDQLPDSKEERERYLLHNNTLENEGYVKNFQQFIEEMVIPHLRPGEQALDFGCGPGPVLKVLLEDRGYPTRIYDPYFYPELAEGSRYSLITATEVLEHVYASRQLFEQLLGHLLKGGILAITTYFHPGPEDFLDWWYRRDPTHVSFYSLKTFQWVVDYFPFKLLDTDGKKMLALRRLGQ